MVNIEERVNRIREDREHGSRWLVRETIALLHELAISSLPGTSEQLQHFRAVARELAVSRPAMAAIAGAVGQILSAEGGFAGMAKQANQLLEEYERSIEHIASYARPLLYGTLMTHSLSGTVLEVLSACQSQLERILVLEGRPRYEGRETARVLSERGMPVTLITDAQADIFLTQCQAVVVGADSVLATGDILNKVGTALLAWAARGHKVPFYVLSETLKISAQDWVGELSQLEEKEPEEVWDKVLPGITVRNFYFDRTPARLVTKLITEQGVLDTSQIKQKAKQLKKIMADLT